MRLLPVAPVFSVPPVSDRGDGYHQLDNLLVGRYALGMKENSTRERILDSAQALAQARGFNAFSYADIATELGVKKASIHYHFPSKQNLETQLLERYRESFAEQLRSIESRLDTAEEQLSRYSKLYLDTLGNGQICLAGMMASDVGALPEQLAPVLTGFFDEHIAWLTKIMSKGKQAGELNFAGTAQAQAGAFLAALQGGLILANAMGDTSSFKRLRTTLIAQLT